MLPLPVIVICSPSGAAARAQAERLRDAQAAAVKQGQHGDVALGLPVAGGDVGGRLDDLRRIGDRQRLRDGTRQFRGAQDGECRARREAAAFEKSDEAAHDRQARAPSSCARPRAARCARKARKSAGASCAERREARLLAADARSGNRERRRGRGRRRRSCAARRAARRPARPPTARSPRADPRRRKTAPAARVPAVLEKPAAASGRNRGRSPRRSSARRI